MAMLLITLNLKNKIKFKYYDVSKAIKYNWNNGKKMMDYRCSFFCSLLWL